MPQYVRTEGVHHAPDNNCFPSLMKRQRSLKYGRIWRRIGACPLECMNKPVAPVKSWADKLCSILDKWQHVDTKTGPTKNPKRKLSTTVSRRNPQAKWIQSLRLNQGGTYRICQCLATQKTRSNYSFLYLILQFVKEAKSPAT